mmetsp:Transcript_33982/g.43682  ORF Transcript_33982/g.43682 Transcript_33982/m.43682 type:complete len:163 (+) Transcript_33982:31-519(+)
MNCLKVFIFVSLSLILCNECKGFVQFTSCLHNSFSLLDKMEDSLELPQPLSKFIDSLDENPNILMFEDTMEIISEHFEYTPKPFRNGDLRNSAGENEGSCKVMSLGKLLDLSEDQVLKCFGEHYRGVLEDPYGTAHGNIRSFMRFGWDGIHFDEGSALSAKK